MKKIGLAIVIIFCLFLTIKGALAEEITIDETQLPYSNSITLNVNLTPNKIFSVSTSTTYPYLNLTFPKNISTIDNITQIQVNYSISPFLVLEDITYEQNLIFNDTVNKTIYPFSIKIKKHSITDVQNYFNISLIDSTYVINSTLDLLPKNGSIKFRLLGVPGQNINVTCGEWLSCPPYITFQENISILEVMYAIPKDASLGEYKRLITIINFNSTITQEVIFQILVPSVFLQKCGFDYGSCLSSPTKEEYLKCVAGGIAEEQQCEQLQKQEFYKLGLKMFENESQIKEIERLVMVGSVDNELRGLYDACSAQLGNFQQQFNSCTEEKNILTIARNDLQNALNQSQQESLRVQNFLLNETKKKINEAEAKVRWRNWAFIIVFVGTIGYISYKRKYEENNLQRLT